jgi:hypothetical protein
MDDMCLDDLRERRVRRDINVKTPETHGVLRTEYLDCGFGAMGAPRFLKLKDVMRWVVLYRADGWPQTTPLFHRIVTNSQPDQENLGTHGFFNAAILVSIAEFNSQCGREFALRCAKGHRRRSLQGANGRVGQPF